jgi:hypothetical protein
MKEVSKVIAENQEVEDTTEAEEKLSDMQYDTFIKLCKFGLADELKGEKTEKQFTEYLEGVLDEPTIEKILEATGGLKLNDGGQNLTHPGTNPDPAGMN